LSRPALGRVDALAFMASREPIHRNLIVPLHTPSTHIQTSGTVG
jgi:hypothetical protein